MPLGKRDTLKFGERKREERETVAHSSERTGSTGAKDERRRGMRRRDAAATRRKTERSRGEERYGGTDALASHREKRRKGRLFATCGGRSQLRASTRPPSPFLISPSFPRNINRTRKGDVYVREPRLTNAREEYARLASCAVAVSCTFSSRRTSEMKISRFPGNRYFRVRSPFRSFVPSFLLWTRCKIRGISKTRKIQRHGVQHWHFAIYTNRYIVLSDVV